jgi:hypothetical protein
MIGSAAAGVVYVQYVVSGWGKRLIFCEKTAVFHQKSGFFVVCLQEPARSGYNSGLNFQSFGG